MEPPPAKRAKTTDDGCSNKIVQSLLEAAASATKVMSALKECDEDARTSLRLFFKRGLEALQPNLQRFDASDDENAGPSEDGPSEAQIIASKLNAMNLAPESSAPAPLTIPWFECVANFPHVADKRDFMAKVTTVLSALGEETLRECRDAAFAKNENGAHIPKQGWWLELARASGLAQLGYLALGFVVKPRRPRHTPGENAFRHFKRGVNALFRQHGLNPDAFVPLATPVIARYRSFSRVRCWIGLSALC